MKIKVLLFFAVAVLLVSCVATKNKNYTFNQKHSAQKIKDDIILLKQILEANHPSLYWYTTKDSLDYYFAQTLVSITDSLTELHAKNKISLLVNKIKCGHTAVRFSKQFVSMADKNKYPQFPLMIKTWADTMVVIGRYNIADSALPRGTIIKSINGKTAKEIVEKMLPYIPTDGYANQFKSQVISNSFAAWYKNIFSIDSTYKIEYIDTFHQPKTITIKAYSPLKDTSKKVANSLKIDKKNRVEKISAKQKRINKILGFRSLSIDTANNTAFVKLATFSNGNLNNFFRKSFREIQKKQVKNLVIDIRENGGGSLESSILLLRFLKDSSFKIADTAAAITHSLAYKKHIKGWFKYWLLMQLDSRKKESDKYHKNYFEEQYFMPKKNNHFSGNTYIVQGAYSFSAATVFSSFLKGQKNVTIVGEESGGGFYGNTAMQIPNIILPNTKLQVRLPLYRYVMDKTRPKGRGVVPDIYVEPSSHAIKKGIDLKMMEVKKND